MILHVADLFCGAGGTSAGAVEAAEALGYHTHLTAINHWPVAVATHTANHPLARHLCTSIDDVNPRSLYAEGQLDLLWASPECTHHSVARGGRPMSDQSRATAWCVVRWAEALRPNVILVENVPEFISWGAIGVDGRPMKSKKGDTFRAWKAALESLGYRVEHRVLCAADYGDPTTRERLFVQAVRGKRRVVWPEPTHGKCQLPDLYTKRRAWATARDEVIDWTLPAQSIYERKRPLSPKTMKRIMEGLRKFGLKAMTMSAGGPECPARPVDEPLGTVLTRDHRAVAEPFIVGCEHTGANGSEVRPADAPISTVTANARKGLAQPFLICMEHQGSVRNIDRPMPTVTTAKGGAIAVAEPFIIGAGGPEYSSKPKSVNDPIGTVACENHRGLVDPFLIELRGTDAHQVENSARSLDGPISVVATSGAHHGLVESFLVQVAHGNDATKPNEDARRSKPVDAPMGTVPASNGQWGLAQPFLVNTAHGGERTAKSVDEPLPTTCGNRGDMAVIQPHLLPQQSDGALRPVDEPTPTVATAGAIALVEPFLVEYYGNGKAQSVDEPIGTATCKDRFALARPVVIVDGKRYLLDIRFRMLQPHELAAAQGFRKDFKFTGTKTEQVKQIGNAVPRRLARAIVAAALSQNPDVSFLLNEPAAA